MKVLKKSMFIKLFIGVAFASSVFMLASPTARAAGSTADGQPCSSGDTFLGVLVPWYYYIKSDIVYENNICGFKGNFTTSSSGINDSAKTGGLDVIWLVALAVFEDLLRVAGIVAVGFVIYGGIRYTTSQGEPENTKAALDTILNALIGTAIVAIAATLVSFLGNTLG